MNPLIDALVTSSLIKPVDNSDIRYVQWSSWEICPACSYCDTDDLWEECASTHLHHHLVSKTAVYLPLPNDDPNAPFEISVIVLLP